MEGDHIKTYPLLTPLSWFYAAGVMLRNALFDCGILHSRQFDVPVISVGNLTAGGTGKTPHTEYLIRLLSQKYQVAVLSRGYKRKSKGFVLAQADTPMQQIGDEPYQMKQKFPDVHVAVDKDRCHGITELCKPNVKPSVEVVLLDDAYQHRYVKPGINILLMDYHRLIYFDRLLPAGRLREPQSGKMRADIVIVTKCPTYITPMDMRGIERTLNLQPWQKLFFSTYHYPSTLNNVGDKPLLVTGIASPKQLEYDLRKVIPQFDMMTFPDHHAYTKKDIERIRKRANGHTILTTEKDATRLTGLEVQVIPIEVAFIGNNKQEEFNKTILSYVQTNKRNSCILEGKNAHTA